MKTFLLVGTLQSSEAMLGTNGENRVEMALEGHPQENLLIHDQGCSHDLIFS